jgi:sterol desaturase/sphingolipid hydroxylase (fatty acid hydroxylase superfamily)
VLLATPAGARYKIPMELARALAAFVLAGAVFVTLERLLALQTGQPTFRRGWFTDLVYVLVNRPVIQGGLIVLLVGVGVGARRLVPGALQAAVGHQPLWLQVVEAVVVADLGFYLAHRAFHAVPWLWRFHAIHHSTEHLDWLAAARVHPVDQILTKGASLLPLFALGYSGAAVGIYGWLYFWHSYLVHANLRVSLWPFGWLIASPRFHHTHHARDRATRDRNFAGQLSVLDLVFGTLCVPAPRPPAAYGVDDPVPATYVGQLLYPFSRTLRA